MGCSWPLASMLSHNWVNSWGYAKDAPLNSADTIANIGLTLTCHDTPCSNYEFWTEPWITGDLCTCSKFNYNVYSRLSCPPKSLCFWLCLCFHFCFSFSLHHSFCLSLYHLCDYVCQYLQLCPSICIWVLLEWQTMSYMGILKTDYHPFTMSLGWP